MTRADTIRALQFAGWHRDMGAFTRLYCENRISIHAAREAYAQGYQMRENGMTCNCFDCRNQTRKEMTS